MSPSTCSHIGQARLHISNIAFFENPRRNGDTYEGGEKKEQQQQILMTWSLGQHRAEHPSGFVTFLPSSVGGVTDSTHSTDG